MQRIMILVIGVILLLLSATACTYSVILMHTEGQASDMVDEIDTITPSADITIPTNP